MKEIKVEKDVVLSDCYYYLKMMWNEIKVMLESALLKCLEFRGERKFYNRVCELNDARFMLSGYTTVLEFDIIEFKNGKNLDIDSNIKEYNDACNTVIRNLINKDQ